MLFNVEQMPYQRAFTHLPWTKKEYAIFFYGRFIDLEIIFQLYRAKLKCLLDMKLIAFESDSKR